MRVESTIHPIVSWVERPDYSDFISECLGSAFAAALVCFLNDLENDVMKDAACEKLARMLVDQQP
jgi:hypothetical protein